MCCFYRHLSSTNTTCVPMICCTIFLYRFVHARSCKTKQRRICCTHSSFTYLITRISVNNGHSCTTYRYHDTCMRRITLVWTCKKDISSLWCIRTTIFRTKVESSIIFEVAHSCITTSIFRKHCLADSRLICTPAYKHCTPCPRINTIPVYLQQ